MKRLFLITALFIAVLSACVGRPPNITLEEQNIDLGEVVNGETRTIEISLRNDGSSDLVIEAVTTSCGCTTAEVSPTTILPGESGLLLINFDSGAHGPDENGPVMRQIFIASNDPDQAEIEFRFTADVVPSDS